MIKKPCSFEHIRYSKYSVIHCYRCGGHRKVEKTEIGQEMKKRVDQAKAEMREKCWTEPDCDLRFTYVEKEQVEPQTYSVNGKEYKRIPSFANLWEMVEYIQQEVKKPEPNYDHLRILKKYLQDTGVDDVRLRRSENAYFAKRETS